MRAGVASGHSADRDRLPQSAVEAAQAMQQGAGLFPVDRVNMAPDSARMRRREEAQISQASCFCFWRGGI